jgi:RNA polymerase-binding transcription factor DksA
MKCDKCGKKIIGARVQIIHPDTRKVLATYCPDCADKMERVWARNARKEAA